MTPPDDDDPPKKKYPRASWETPDPDDAPVPAKKKSEKSGASKTPPDPAPVSSSRRLVDPMSSGSGSGGWSIGPPSPALAGPSSSDRSARSSTASESGVRDTAPGGYKPPDEVAASDSGTPEAVPTATSTAPVSTSAIVATTPAETSTSVAKPRDDEPLLPLPSSLSDDDDDELRLAVGAKPKKRAQTPVPDYDDPDEDDFDGDGPRKRGRLVMFVLLVVAFGLAIGAFVIFGHINKQRYMIACEPQQVIAKQGRGFPPWGERAIDDDGMWKPIKIPPEAECRERETEDIDELSRWYLDILMDRASSLLTAREVTKIDDAAGMLEQALLHARTPERRSDRRDIDRLLGDVGYWRASAKLKDAAGALSDAAKQFDAAAAQRPRHVSDASAWASYVRKLAEELKAGPNGTSSTVFPPTPPIADHQPAPPGVALPVEPTAGSGSAEPPPPPIDAGLPTGGVLL